MTSPYWDLVTATIWIMTRRAGDVAASAPIGARNWLDADLIASWHAISGEQLVASSDEAKELLIAALRNGDFECLATIDGEERAVTMREWSKIRIQEGQVGLELLHRTTATIWREPLVKRIDVLKVWPAEVAPTVRADSKNEAPVMGDDETLAYRTGVAGRPSSIQFVLTEIERRKAAGAPLPQSKKTLSEDLESWLPDAHPQAARMTAKAMRNNAAFRSAWNHWMSAQAPSARNWRPK